MPGPAPKHSLAAARPDLLAEAVRAPGRVCDIGALGLGSNIKVLWRCKTCCHEWTTAVAARAQAGTGCPECAWPARGRSRAQAPTGKSLLDLHPDIAAEYQRNLDRPDMGPADLRASSQQRCLWKCGRCATEWESTVANRAGGRGCPSCANKARAASRRVPRQDGATAATTAPAIVGELVENLTNPGIRLDQLRPSSVDRCAWQCQTCEYRWTATVTNRVTKKSGCPRCAIARNTASRRTPRPGRALSEVAPSIAAEFITNISVPGRGPDNLNAGSNNQCQWHCRKGHTWTTTVASRVAGTGCGRCARNGRSLFEHEVAELVAAATSSQVQVDVGVEAEGRTWRVDLRIDAAAGLLVDLDPTHWHRQGTRDKRKTAAMRGQDYVRVRPRSLPDLHCDIIRVDDGCEDPAKWAEALRRAVTRRGGSWRKLTLAERATAMALAFATWQTDVNAPPVPNALDGAEHLAGEFLRNLHRDGVTLEWLTPSARDMCEWQCTICQHIWTSSVASRSRAGTGCPVCARAHIDEGIRIRSLPRPGQSLAELHPAIAAEYQCCLTDPARTPATLRPASNLSCTWKCSRCGHVFKASPAGRAGGRGCAICGRERARQSRSLAPDGKSLAEVHPDIAAEFLSCTAEPSHTAGTLLPGSNKACRWLCATCSHEWSAAVATRTTGGGCPACGRLRTIAGRTRPEPGRSLADLHPELAAEFISNETNPLRVPATLKPGSHDRCCWRCTRCGFEWLTSVKNRARNGTGCRSCHRKRVSTSKEMRVGARADQAR
jgi:hypothetical protein